ncbi:MAG: sigma-70 family RNA polymerase sigma factor [Sphingobacteriaceae bacterium]|nr:sigma-70 family RNA polymerase sigma factor [Sphingobacteriaceae bacterium]
MTVTEIIQGLHKNDKACKKYLFETHYGKLFALVQRYCKSQAQATEIFHVAFNFALQQLQQSKNTQINLPEFLEKEVIQETIRQIKNLRSEYYVASTVYATQKLSSDYDLFNANQIIDYYTVDMDILIKALQQLVPSQRLIFNLHIIEGYSIEEAARLLEASEQTVKSNLEKARFNLQKNIEKSLRQTKYEQSF